MSKIFDHSQYKKPRHSLSVIRRLDSDRFHMHLLACFSCRKVFKQRGSEGAAYESFNGKPCNICGEELVDVGSDFHAPTKNNKAQWVKVEVLVSFGFFFHPTAEGPGNRPKSMSELIPFLVSHGITETEARKKIKYVQNKRKNA